VACFGEKKGVFKRSVVCYPSYNMNQPVDLLARFLPVVLTAAAYTLSFGAVAYVFKRYREKSSR